MSAYGEDRKRAAVGQSDANDPTETSADNDPRLRRTTAIAQVLRSKRVMPASVLDRCDRYVRRDRAGVSELGRADRRHLGAVGFVDELVEHGLDRRLSLLRSGITHVIMLEVG